MFEDYKAWLKVADTALPRNILGYLIQFMLSPLRAKPFDITPYDHPKHIAECGPDVGTKSFLTGKLPDRGERPTITKWMAPHRQTSQLTGDEMHELLAEAIKELVEQHSTHVTVKTSVLEKAGDALHLIDSCATPHVIAKKVSREIAHVHTGVGSGEYSVHLTVSPEDCKEVITKRWGERMTLAGTLVPHEYLLVYTPRSRDEVAIVKDIVAASIAFMTGGRSLDG